MGKRCVSISASLEINAVNDTEKKTFLFMMTSFLHFKHYLHSVQIVLLTPYHTTVFCIVATFFYLRVFFPFYCSFPQQSCIVC